jgi:ABC-type amino acid transport substrate-binding protein
MAKGEIMMSFVSLKGRSMGRKLASLIAFVVMLCTALFASAGTLDRVKKTGKLNLGYVDNMRPYSFRNEAGNPDGYGIELCKAIAESAKAELGAAVTVNFVAVPLNEALRSVAQGKVDLLCAPQVPTVATRKEVSFSTPVFASGIGAMVRSDAPRRLRDILSGQTPRNSPLWRANADQALQRSTLGVMAGGRAEKELMDGLSRLRLSTTIVPVDDIAAGAAAVATQRIDAFFGDRALLLDAAKRHKGAVNLVVLDRFFTHEVGAFALARGDEDFRLVVDQALGSVIYSDDFAVIHGRWFGPLSDKALTIYRLNALRD